MGSTYAFRVVEKDSARAYLDITDQNVGTDASGVVYYQIPE